MAESLTASSPSPAAAVAASASAVYPKPLGGVRTYLLVAHMWLRAAAQYRATLVLMTLNSAMAASLEIVAVLLLFANTKSLAGFSLGEVLYLSGTARTAFALSDFLFTGTEYISSRIRLGSFDGLLVRPVGVLPQIFAERFSPRRLGGLAAAGTMLGVGIATSPVAWTPLRVAMVVYTVLGGVAVFGAIWTLVGAFQIVATDASEVMNAVTYGGSFLTSYPLALYGRDFGLFLTFGLPMAFINWQPSLYVLNHADPLGLPSAFRFAAPIAAALLWTAALAAWRTALRRHRSTGS